MSRNIVRELGQANTKLHVENGKLRDSLNKYRKDLTSALNALRAIASVTDVQSDFRRAEDCQKIARSGLAVLHNNIEKGEASEGKS